MSRVHHEFDIAHLFTGGKKGQLGIFLHSTSEVEFLLRYYMFAVLKNYHIHTCVYTCVHMLQHACGGLSTTCGSLFSPSTIRVVGNQAHLTEPSC